MIDAVVKTLSQMFTPPFRHVLLKSIGLALVLLVVLGIGTYHGFTWLATSGAVWGESHANVLPHAFWTVLVWIFTFAAGIGIVTGAVFLMPAVSALIGSFFVDEVADHVEAVHYTGEMPGVALPFSRALFQGIKTALLALLVYVLLLPFILFLGIGFIVLFLANAYLLSREYFELEAMRFRPPAEAKALRRAHRGQVFLAGLFIAAVVSIPIVNLVTPLFAMALMVHIYKRVAGKRVEIIDAKTPKLPR
jgi:uncharacterized protein involved in cysteine biosynthesis